MEARMSRAKSPGDGPHTGFQGHLTTADEAEPGAAYDALTDLFLGDPAPAAATATTAAPAAAPRAAVSPAEAPRIEGLILGHLPVLASAWVQQYARHLAASLRGPVALVKLRAGEASLEILGEPAARQRPDAEAGSLEAAVAAAAGHVRAWLIRVDDVAEPILAESADLDAVTLLTGADEAAVVASYRTIKQLFRPADDEDSGPGVQLAIMGAGADRAGDASQKLQRAAETFLGRRVTVSSCVAKIGSGRAATLFRGPLDRSGAEILSWLIPAAREPSSSPAHRKPAGPTLALAAEFATPAARPAPQPAAAPAHGNGSAHAIASEHPLLAAQIPGLTPVVARCPYTPGVELAVDSAGTLHLLAHADQVGPAPAVGQLLTAAAWASTHRDLLCMALAPALAHGDRPVLHLMTRNARDVRHMGDADIRLHLLARVQAGGGAAWFCTELN